MACDSVKACRPFLCTKRGCEVGSFFGIESVSESWMPVTDLGQDCYAWIASRRFLRCAATIDGLGCCQERHFQKQSCVFEIEDEGLH